MNHVNHHSHLAGLAVAASGMPWLASAPRSPQRLAAFIAGACALNGSLKRVFAGF
jgi:hypothetical protein